MYVRDHARPEFHKAIGIDPTDYDFRVFRLTSEIARQVFPVEIDIDNPRFLKGLEKLRLINNRVEGMRAQTGILARVKRWGYALSALSAFVGLYAIPARKNALPAQIRLEPVW
jgi:magnesium-protoporphyrin IX monomethyl ester (oxidative) cyclase